MAIPDGLASYAWTAVAAGAAPALLGVGVLRALGLRERRDRAAIWAIGYVVGHYVMAHGTLLWLIAGKPVPGVLLPVAAAAVGAWLLRRAAGATAPHAAPQVAQPPWWSWTATAIAVLLLLVECLGVNAEPVRRSDEAVNWAAKAKVLFGAQDFAVKDGLDFFVQHPDYPLFNPLVQVLAFASNGRILHFENRVPVQLFGVALLLLLSAGLLRRTHPVTAGLAVLAFVGTTFPSIATTAYADVMLACAVLVAAESMLRARETGDAAWWRAACLGLGAAISCKNEGLMLAMALGGAFALDHVVRTGRNALAAISWREAAWLGVPLGAVALHQGFNRAYGIRNDLTDAALAGGRGMLGRILEQGTTYGPDVLAYYGRMLVEPGMHRLLPLAFLVATIVACFAGRRDWLLSPAAVLFVTFVGATLGYMLVFVSTIYDLGWHMDVAADRTMQHVLPLCTLGLGALAWPRAAATPPSE